MEDAIKSLETKQKETEQNKAKQSSVDLFSISKHVESTLKKIELANAAHTTRVVQVENNTKALQIEINGLSQDFKNKVSKLGGNIIKISNVREEIKIRIDQFSQILNQLHDGFIKNNLVQDEAINSMKDLLRGEMKDLKSSNDQFDFELQRMQTLFRQLQSELHMTMEEKKAQNQNILQTVTEAATETKKALKDGKGGSIGKRSQSMSQ